MTDRDTRAEIADVLTKVLHVELGDVTMVDMADYWALPNERAILGDKLADALIAAGLVVPSGLTAEKLLRDVLAEMDAAAKWAFPCLQPHSESIVAAREWADALSTQETL